MRQQGFPKNLESQTDTLSPQLTASTLKKEKKNIDYFILNISSNPDCKV